MKKRLLLILVVLSIILSVCTASILAASAADNSEEEEVGIFPPQNIRMIDRGDSVYLSWNSVYGAKRYCVAWGENDNKFAFLNVKETYINIPRLSPQKTYYFVLFANKSENDNLSDPDVSLPSKHYVRPGRPKLGNVSNMIYNNESIININWSPVPWNGADNKVKYYVYYKYKSPNSNTYSKQYSSAPTTNTYWNIKNPQYGLVFDIEIHAVVSSKNSQLIIPSNIPYTKSNSKTVKINTLQTPVYGINYSGNYFNVYWKAISGASEYEICRFYNGQKKYYLCDNDSKGYNNITISANNQVSFIDRGISKVGPYVYQIRAINSNGERSSWSKYVSVRYNPKVRPTNKQRFVDIANATLNDYGKKYWDKAKEWHEKWHEEDVYDGREADWCCMYAAWILNEMNELDVDVKDTYGYYIDAGNFADNLMTLGKWRNRGSYTPKVGDVIIFGDNPINGRNHVGVVTAVSGGKVYTNEGNTGSDYCDLARVNRKSYSLNDSYILGYGCTYIS